MTVKLTQKPEFDARFPSLLKDILDDLAAYKLPKEALEWFSNSINYNVVGGKMNRGISVVDSFKVLNASKSISDQDIADATVLGWCVEWLQAFFLVADDIMDGSKTRRGQPCWYMKEKVGNIAINDAFLLEACVYKLIKKHFRNKPYYVDLLELFLESTWQTELGQLVDLITAPVGEVDLSRFNSEKYYWIVRFKTAYYSFYLPVALAMHMSGITDIQAFEEAKSILVPLGEYFQVQDDFLDCFGKPEVIGKIGTDIQDNKCSWLVVQALGKASTEQMKLLEENYGKDDEPCISRVKEIYRSLGLETTFSEYEESSYLSIRKMIEEAHFVPGPVYMNFMNRIYKRTK